MPVRPRRSLASARARGWSFRLTLLLCGATVLLLAAGALVTGTGSSLAVPDWPLAYGQVFPPMVGGILYEHGHRLIAATVGLLSIVAALWLWWVEPRGWVRGLGFAALGLVVAQGLLGGITVLLLLPKAVSIAHAFTAQVFFLLTLALAQATAPGWEALVGGRGRAGAGRVRWWAGATLALLLVALLLGATVRHFGAGLSIPDFPLAFGRLVPPLESFHVAIHFLHRVAALLVLLAVIAAVWETRRSHPAEPRLLRPALAMLALAVVQVALGAAVIWSRRAVPVTTLHLVNGALLLGATGLLARRAALLEGGPAARRTRAPLTRRA